MMYRNMLILTAVSPIGEVIKAIEDNGIMLVISAVVIYFLIKVLNSLLAQSASILSDIRPQISQIQDLVSDVMIKLNETETRRSLLNNKQFAELKDLNKDINSRIKSMDKELISVKDSLKDINDRIEKQQMYLDFYKEHMEKGDD